MRTRPRFRVSQDFESQEIDLRLNRQMAKSLAALLTQLPADLIGRFVKDATPIKALAERLSPAAPPAAAV